MKSQKELLEHSQAKVNLYGYYLSIYLNIISRVRTIDKIFLFDLLAGEGIYENGEKGSPLVAIKVLQKLFSSQDCCTPIEVWFNDLEMSQIEPEIPKIERVKKIVLNEPLPKEVNVSFFQRDYNRILIDAINTIKNTRYAKGLFFIDPYGYKDINPEDLKNILNCRDTEIILFLPISHMYRFAEKSLRDPSSGSFPLRNFLLTVFNNSKARFSSVDDFIASLKKKLTDYLGEDETYITTFRIQRNSSNVYCLFYFTSHIYGLEKMIEAKWAKDQYQGIGYKVNSSPMLFSELELRNYSQRIIDFINESPRTNFDVYRFGLLNDFLPKHTNKVLNKLKKQNKIAREAIDGKPNRGNYINHKMERIVQSSIRK